MKANELRIGNFFTTVIPIGGSWMEKQRVDKETYQVKPCTFQLIDNFEYFKGIPLTRERLLEFSFETDGVTFYKKGLNHYRINLFNTGNNKDFNESGFSVTVYQSKMCIEIRRIQYVHQLQNIWFELTGEELTK